MAAPLPGTGPSEPPGPFASPRPSPRQTPADEEFYAPYLLQIHDLPQFLALRYRWLYVYNLLRPHFGAGMEQRSPLATLRHLGYTGDDHIALLPPILLDPISTDPLLSCDKQDGNDLLATY